MAGKTPSHQIPYPVRTDPFLLTRDIQLALDKIDMLLAQGLGESGAALTKADEALLLAVRAELVARQKSTGVHIGTEPPAEPMLWVKTDAEPSGAGITSADITDSTSVGRAVLTATDSLAARNSLDIWTGTRALLDAGTDTAERTWGAKELHEYVTDTAAEAGGAASWDDLTGKPTTFPPSAHTHDDRYYTETEVDTKITALTRSTGWRNISHPSLTAGKVQFLRTGSRVYMNWDAAVFGTLTGTQYMQQIVPDGFRTDIWIPFTTVALFGPALGCRLITGSNGPGSIHVSGLTSGAVLRAYLTWETNQAWPSVLPGEPA